jgi:hypothetical protein
MCAQMQPPLVPVSAPSAGPTAKKSAVVFEGTTTDDDGELITTPVSSDGEEEMSTEYKRKRQVKNIIDEQAEFVTKFKSCREVQELLYEHDVSKHEIKELRTFIAFGVLLFLIGLVVMIHLFKKDSIQDEQIAEVVTKSTSMQCHVSKLKTDFDALLTDFDVFKKAEAAKFGTGTVIADNTFENFLEKWYKAKNARTTEILLEGCRSPITRSSPRNCISIERSPFKLVLQDDHNWVSYKTCARGDPSAIWSSNTCKWKEGQEVGVKWGYFDKEGEPSTNEFSVHVYLTQQPGVSKLVLYYKLEETQSPIGIFIEDGRLKLKFVNGSTASLIQQQ